MTKKNSNPNQCAFPSCSKMAVTKGYCDTHYKKTRREGFEMGAGDERPFLSQLAEGLIKVVEQPANIKVWEWVRDNVILPPSERKGFAGKHIDFSIAPDIKFVLEFLNNPECEKIVLQFSAQSGKTLFILAAIIYLTSIKKKSGLFYLPTEYLFKTFPPTRMEPFLKQKGDYDEKNSKKPVYMFNAGNYLRVGMAGNPSSLAEMPADWVIGDEIDEIRESKLDPKELARNRLRTAHHSLEILSSTPKLERGGITDEYNNTKQYEIEAPCPQCKAFVVITWKDFRFPDDADYKEVKHEGLAWVECPECGGQITDEHHYAMIKKQRWRCLQPNASEIEVGFKKRVWNTIFMNYSDVAAKYLECKDSPDRLADFYHSYCAEAIDTDTDSKEIMKSDITAPYFRERKEIPAEVQVLTAACDIGKNEIWFMLMGWGADGEKFNVWDCRIDREQGKEGWDKAKRGIGYATDINQYTYLGPKEYTPHFSIGLIDSGYDTQLVYDFCRENPLWFPVKGDSSTSRPWELSKADPRRRFRGRYSSMTLYVVNPHYWEDVLQSSLETGSGPGGFNVMEDVHDRYLKHLEGSIKKRVIDRRTGRQRFIWIKKGRAAENHLRDCTYYNIAAGFIKGLHALKKRTIIRDERPKVEKNIMNLKKRVTKRVI